MKKIVYSFIYTALLFSACKGDENAIKIKGSDTEVNLAVEMAEAFYQENDNYSIAVSGGGSGLGIASLYNGQADIANSSRPLNDEEIKLFDEKNIKIITNIFAEDATAIVVNKNNPLIELSVNDLGKIFSGEINNWKDINGQNNPINIYGRQGNSGTHSFIQSKLKIKFSNKAKEMNGNAQIMEGIKVDPTGIGYVGAGYLLSSSNDDRVKVILIKEDENGKPINPLDSMAIANKQYFFQRPLYQFIAEKSIQKVKHLMDFEKADKGKSIIIRSGYYVLD